MYKKVSYWEENTFLKDIDIAIVGSGIVGVTAALSYKDRFPTKKVVILERGVLPTGASTKNAGFACFGSITELIADYQLYGIDTVLQLLQQRWEGLQQLRERVGDRSLDYQEDGGYELLLETENHSDILRYIPFFNEQIAKVIGVQDTFRVVDAWEQFGFGKRGIIIKNKAEGCLDPGKMMMRLLEIARQKGIQILNGFEVVDFKEEEQFITLTSSSFELRAQKILFATNGFTARLFPQLDIQPARNQVLLTQPIPDLKFKGCFHFEEGYYYFRNIGNRILLGGARNRDKARETTDELGETAIIQNSLSSFLQEIVLPKQPFQIAHSWSGILGIGPSKVPIIKKVSDRIGVAARLGGMGVAIGSIVGVEGARLFE